MPNMTIMRGGPGSGKSTIAKKLASDSKRQPVICSADDFFLKPDGSYEFDFLWLGRAHGACFKKCVEAIMGRQDVIIDNTNAGPEEMLPYLALCQAFGYTCVVVRAICDPEIAWARQTHGVPRETFDKIWATVTQHQVPKTYRDAPWITIKDVRTDVERSPVCDQPA